MKIIRKRSIIKVNSTNMKFFNYFDSSEYFPNCSQDEVFECINSRCFDNVLNLFMVLDSLRDFLHYPIVVSSSYRDTLHNKRVKGSATSQHLQGAAVDFSCKKIPFITLTYLVREFFEKSALADFVGQVIFYHKREFIHIGLRTLSHPNLTYLNYEQRND